MLLQLGILDVPPGDVKQGKTVFHFLHTITLLAVEVIDDVLPATS
jgi:hypothetical protein